MESYTKKKGGIKISTPTEKKFKNPGSSPYGLVEENEIPKEVLDDVVEDNLRMINSNVANDLKALGIVNDSDLNQFLIKRKSKPKEKIILPVYYFDYEGNIVVPEKEIKDGNRKT